MTFKYLSARLLSDARRVGIDTTSLSLHIKPYSKMRWGTYNPKDNSITLYVFLNEKGKLPQYKKLLAFFIHECVHYTQWNDPEFIRYKGIMHNAEFYSLYEKFMMRLNNDSIALKMVNVEADRFTA